MHTLSGEIYRPLTTTQGTWKKVLPCRRPRLQGESYRHSSHRRRSPREISGEYNESKTTGCKYELEKRFPCLLQFRQLCSTQRDRRMATWQSFWYDLLHWLNMQPQSKCCTSRIALEKDEDFYFKQYSPRLVHFQKSCARIEQLAHQSHVHLSHIIENKALLSGVLVAVATTHWNNVDLQTS